MNNTDENEREILSARAEKEYNEWKEENKVWIAIIKTLLFIAILVGFFFLGKNS